MLKAVLDSTVLVSAFLSRAGVSRQLLQYASQEGIEFYVIAQLTFHLLIIGKSGILYLKEY